MIFKKFLLLIFLFLPLAVSAHPGNTDVYGCHTCYTNCSAWGLDYGEYHCHAPKVSAPLCSSPLSSLDCDVSSNLAINARRGLIGTDFGNAQISACQAKHDSYVQMQADYQTCLSTQQSTKSDIPAASSVSNQETERLELIIKMAQICSAKGANFNFDTLACNCSVGLSFDKDGKSCVSNDSICQTKLGENSHSLDQTSAGSIFFCVCNDGYVQSNRDSKCGPKLPQPSAQTPVTTTKIVQLKTVLLPSTLKFAARGANVTKLQQFLVDNGYTNLKPTGYFGSVTRHALLKFQKDNGLKRTGWLDQQTLDLINNL